MPEEAMRTEDVKQAIMQQLASQAEPTEAPTEQATPTEQPTEAQANAPTEAPVEQPTDMQPTEQAPIEQPMDATTPHIDAEQPTPEQANMQQQMQQQMQVAQENEMLKQEIARLNDTLRQQSANATAEIVSSATGEPTFDPSELMYLSPEESQAKIAEFVSGIKQSVLNSDEMKGMRDEYAKAREERELYEIINDMANSPELKGYDVRGSIGDMITVMQNNPFFNNPDMAANDKVFDAMLIAEGVKSLKSKLSGEADKIDYDKIMDLYHNDSELQRRINGDRVQQLKQNQQVPPQSASSGFASVTNNIPNKPERVEDVKKSILERLLGR